MAPAIASISASEELPPELRNKVYGYVLTWDKHFVIYKISGHGLPSAGWHQWSCSKFKKRTIGRLNNSLMYERRENRKEAGKERYFAALLGVNSAIYKEASFILYSKNSFAFANDTFDDLTQHLKPNMLATSRFLRSLPANLTQHITSVSLVWNMEFSGRDYEDRQDSPTCNQTWQFNDIHTQIKMLAKYASKIKNVMLLKGKPKKESGPLKDVGLETIRIRARVYLEMILGWEKIRVVMISCDLFSILRKDVIPPSTFLELKWEQRKGGGRLWFVTWADSPLALD